MGKGSKQRPTDMKKYGDNYDRIFSKRIVGTSLQNLRKSILSKEPLCRICHNNGRYIQAEEIDHITPLHKGGNNELDNLQPLCKPCHNKKSIEERGKNYTPRIGTDGYPEED